MAKVLGLRRMSKLVSLWEVRTVVREIRQFQAYFQLVSENNFDWIKREANGLAHVVATNALGGSIPVNWDRLENSPWRRRHGEEELLSWYHSLFLVATYERRKA